VDGMGTAWKASSMIDRYTYINTRIPPEEPVFILRAQDALAADLVEKWAIWARAASAPVDKVNEAFSIAEEMRKWPVRKNPD